MEGRELSRNIGRGMEPIIPLFVTVPSYIGTVPTSTITRHVLKSEAVSFAQQAKPPIVIWGSFLEVINAA